MPNIENPDQTQVKGTMKSATKLRVVAPDVNPSAAASYHAPAGGEFRSTGPEGGTIEETSDDRRLLVPPKASEMWNVFPHERQRATSVETLMSSVAIFARQEGQVICMKFEGIMP
jgi:hypothetical protein